MSKSKIAPELRERLRFVANSHEEFDALEDKAAKFFASYVLEVKYGRIVVSSTILDGVNIAPEDKFKIRTVQHLDGTTAAELITSNQEYVMLELTGINYLVRYTNE